MRPKLSPVLKYSHPKTWNVLTCADRFIFLAMTSVSEDSRRVASSSDLSPRRLLLLWFESKPLGCNLSRSVSACLNLFTNDESTSEAVEVASDLIGRGGGGAGWLFLRLGCCCFWGVWDWWPLLVWFWIESSELALKKIRLLECYCFVWNKQITEDVFILRQFAFKIKLFLAIFKRICDF